MVVVRRPRRPRLPRTPAGLAADAQRLLDLLNALGSTTFRQLLWQRASELDLTFAQSQVLFYVRDHPRCPMGDVAKAFGVTLPAITHIVDRLEEKRRVEEIVQRLRVKTPSLETQVLTLSGGNQQKVVIAKWLLAQPKVLILDEPTRGVDVGAKAEIYHLMNDLARQGVAIVMISSELPEVLGMADRILVMREGQKAAELSRAEATEELIMSYATLGTARVS